MNFKEILKGNLLFMFGFFYGIISVSIIPPFLTAVVSAFTGSFESNTLPAIIWIGLIITWILTMFILPIARIYDGLVQEVPKENQNPIIGATTGILWFLFTLLIIYFAWYWVPILASNINTDYTILVVLYWISVITAIIINAVIVPIFIINKNRGL